MTFCAPKSKPKVRAALLPSHYDLKAAQLQYVHPLLRSPYPAIVIHISNYVTRCPCELQTSHADLDSSGGLLLGQRSESEVWLDDTEIREQCLSLLVLDAGVDNHIITGDPVDWGGDTVLIAGLEGVDDTKDLGGVAAS